MVKIIPEHESAVRRVVSDANKLPYKPLKNLKEARKYDDAVMIIEGDWGGQIYLTCPVNLVKCSEKNLEKLLKDIDKIEWSVNKGEGTGIYYERRKAGEGIIGGSGGGIVERGLWIHPDLAYMKEKIKAVITGNSDSI